MIKQWSFSRLDIWQQCPYRAKLAYIDKIPEPERPLPPGKTEHANDRGTRIHEMAEKFCLGQTEFLAPELHNFTPEFEKLKELANQGRASFEGEWAVNEAWEPTSWFADNVWGRIKTDAFVFKSKHEAIVVDYKTGKRFNNEMKHALQMQLYQLAAFMRYPQLEYVHVELWYLDLDELHRMEYTRSRGEMALAYWNKKAVEMTTASDFPAKPSRENCKWCPYSPDRSGHCVHGVRKQDVPKGAWHGRKPDAGSRSDPG